MSINALWWMAIWLGVAGVVIGLGGILYLYLALLLPQKSGKSRAFNRLS